MYDAWIGEGRVAPMPKCWLFQAKFTISCVIEDSGIHGLKSCGIKDHFWSMVSLKLTPFKKAFQPLKYRKGLQEIIHNVTWTLDWGLRNGGSALYSCLFLVKNHRQCMSTAPELGHEPGKKDFESIALAIMPLGRLSAVCSNSTNHLSSIRHWFARPPAATGCRVLPLLPNGKLSVDIKCWIISLY